MRRREILALRWKNIDFEKKTVRVVESLEQTMPLRNCTDGKKSSTRN
jgi:integrase